MITSRRYLSLLHLRFFSVLLLCAALPILSFGCSNRVGTDAIRNDMASGNWDQLETELEETHDSFGEFVTALNLARIYQIDGNWAKSIKAFEEALAILEEYESRAVLNIRELLADTGTILFSRGAESYYGTGYERSLLHSFNAINYLMLGDFNGAAVEMRRTDKRQEIWLEESQARIEKYLESRQQLNSPDDLPVGYSMRDLLRDNEVRSLINNYQDPFSYSLGAILYRLAGDSQSADISMRRAIALDDAAREMFAKVWPGKQTTPQKQSKPIQPAIPDLPPALNAPKAQEVVVIAFSGLAPALRVESVRIPAPAIGYLLLDLPSYIRPISSPKPTVTVGSQNHELVLYPLLRTSMLAYRTLWDELRMEVTFAVTRAIARAGIAAGTYVAASSHEDTKGYAPLIATMATALMDLFSSAMSESVRNWETLPDTGYLAMGVVRRGETITIGMGGTSEAVTLPHEARGVIIEVTGFSNYNLKVHYVTY